MSDKKIGDFLTYNEMQRISNYCPKDLTCEEASHIIKKQSEHLEEEASFLLTLSVKLHQESNK